MKTTKKIFGDTAEVIKAESNCEQNIQEIINKDINN